MTALAPTRLLALRSVRLGAWVREGEYSWLWEVESDVAAQVFYSEVVSGHWTWRVHASCCAERTPPWVLALQLTMDHFPSAAAAARFAERVVRSHGAMIAAEGGK